jgi:hypothetical protein
MGRQMLSIRGQSFSRNHIRNNRNAAHSSIACFTASRNLSFFMVFDLFSNSVGKTNGSMAKAGVFQRFRMLANCNADWFLR